MFALPVGLIMGAAEYFDLIGHHLPEGFSDRSADQFVEQFARFAFSALQKGSFEFFVGHGGGWFFWFSHRHASAWFEPTATSILTTQGTLPHKIARENLDRLLSQELADRFIALDRLFRFYFLGAKPFCEIFPLEEWPIVVLEEPGRLRLTTWKVFSSAGKVPLTPALVGSRCTKAFVKYLGDRDDAWLKNPGIPWAGEPALLEMPFEETKSTAFSRVSSLPPAVAGLHKSGRYIDPPFFPMPPINQSVMVKHQLEENMGSGRYDDLMAEIRRAVSDDPSKLADDSFDSLVTHSFRFADFLKRFTTVEEAGFPLGCKEYLFLFGGRINRNHPLGKKLFLLSEAAFEKLKNADYPADRRGRFEDLSNRLNFAFHADIHRGKILDLDDLERTFGRLWDELNQVVRLFTPEDKSGIRFRPADLCPGMAIAESSRKLILLEIPQGSSYKALGGIDTLKAVVTFGRPFAESSPWPPTTGESPT